MSPLSIVCGMLSGDRLRAESSNESSDEDKKSQCVAWGGCSENPTLLLFNA